jgi:transcriptional regulator with XRE-family HTH domain
VKIDKLRGKMAEKKVTQKEMAECLGISTQAFNKKMNGKIRFNTNDAAIICQKLNITDMAERAEIFLDLPSQKRNGSEGD